MSYGRGGFGGGYGGGNQMQQLMKQAQKMQEYGIYRFST